MNAIRIDDLSQWTLNRKPVKAIHKFVTEAETCEHHVYLDVKKLRRGKKYTLQTPYGSMKFKFSDKNVFCEASPVMDVLFPSYVCPIYLG